MTTLITDHVLRAINSLNPRWREDLRAQEFVTAFVEEIQELENVLYQLVTNTYLSNAEGAQLDEYGELLGVERNGLIDDEYRALLQVKALANRAPGIVDTITEIARVALFSATGVQYAHNQPASYQLDVSLAFPGAEIHTEANAASIPNEANATTGWSALDAILSSSDAFPYLGTYAIHANAPGFGTSFVSYSFPSVIGVVYRVQFAARRLGVGFDQRVSDWTGVETSPDEPVDSSDWKAYTFFVTANLATIEVVFSALISAGEEGDFLAIDAVSVKPTGDPSDVLIQQAIRLILDATPAGVALNAIVSSPADGAFQFGDGETTEGGGFGEGKLSKLIGP